MKTATLLLVVGVLLFGMLLGIGWLLTHDEPGSAVGAADVGVLRCLVAHRFRGLDTVSLYAVDLASTTTVLVSGAVAGVAVALVRRRALPLVLLVGELVLFLNAAILVGRPRPAVPHLDAALPPTSSFPSGHTAAAICLYGGVATIALRVVRAWWRWLVLGVAVVPPRSDLQDAAATINPGRSPLGRPALWRRSETRPRLAGHRTRHGDHARPGIACQAGRIRVDSLAFIRQRGLPAGHAMSTSRARRCSLLLPPRGRVSPA